MSKFKVGDKVRIVKPRPDSLGKGLTFIVHEHDFDGDPKPSLDEKRGKELDSFYYDDELELVEPAQDFSDLRMGEIYAHMAKRALLNFPNPPWQATETKGGLMSNIANKVKRLAMNKDDRLLLDYDIVDDEGDLTGEGIDLLRVVAFEHFKDQIVAKVKEVKAEEDK